MDQRGYHEEAGLTFLDANDLTNSINSFKKALNVPQVLSIATRNKITSQNLKELKSEMVEKLISSSRFEEAGDLIDPSENFA